MRFPPGYSTIDIDAMLQQQFNHRHIATGSRHMQGRPALGIDGIDIHASGQQGLHLFDVSALRCHQ